MTGLGGGGGGTQKSAQQLAYEKSKAEWEGRSTTPVTVAQAPRTVSFNPGAAAPYANTPEANLQRTQWEAAKNNTGMATPNTRPGYAFTRNGNDFYYQSDPFSVQPVGQPWVPRSIYDYGGK
jgi:hypothetical protein